MFLLLVHGKANVFLKFVVLYIREIFVFPLMNFIIEKALKSKDSVDSNYDAWPPL